MKVVWWIESWKFLLTCSSNCLFVQGSLTALDSHKTAIYVISINELSLVANCWKHLFLLCISNSSIERTIKMMERWGRLVVQVMTGRSLQLRWSRSPFPNDETTLRIDSHEEQVGSLVRISSRLPDLFHHAPLQICGPQEKVKIIILRIKYLFCWHLIDLK